ncbi:right-handed parallel beta-helix repeat-containing protein [Shouchella clausii]|uniref:right-handed parallel beta-helix repeat-containing protein n=1 Tax=Shouchella clausii TaxID=79880 RepID=UPI000BA639F6|nr:right-handed parallel beta-helix repeat-containing protein [Shouchella clausii]PAE94103.1 hypothetical protein CHH70_09975 [Shouchella clausii]PAF11235.1 hypothetical protein CHH65_00590 [Shouchella clausii]
MKTIHVTRKLLSKYKTIEEALLDASDGDTIKIDPGTYQESVTIAKSVHLVGLGEPETVIIQAPMDIINKASVSIKNISFAECEKGLTVKNGYAQLTHCQFTRLKKWGIHVLEDGHLDLTDATIRHSGIGLFVVGRARAEYCALYSQRGSQVCVSGNGRFVMKHSHIYQGKSAAIYFDQNSRSFVENCQIYGHHSENMQLKSTGNSEAALKDCLIYESSSGGALVLGESKLTLNSCTLTNNVPRQVVVLGGETIIQNSLFETGQIGVDINDNGTAQLEATILTSHEDDHIRVGDGALYVYRSTIKFGQKSGVVLTKNAYAHIESSDLFGHMMPQLAVSEQARVSLKHSAIFYGKHYGFWLTEQASADVGHCRFYENELNQLVIADKSEADLEDIQVFDGAQSGLYIHDHSHANVVNSTFYHHNDLYPQIYVSSHSTITMKESKLYDSYESGIRFDMEASGLLEHCQFSGHYEAQIDIQHSAPTIRECVIENGGTCAIRLLHAGGFIENCTFTGHEHNIAIGGECDTDIIGQEADALRQYAEALSVTEEMEAQLSQAEMRAALEKAQKDAEREERTVEIVGLVEELEEQLGKK